MNLIFYFILNFSASQASQITYEEVMNEVLSNFPKIQIAKKEIEIATGEKFAADGNFDMNLQGSYIKNRGYYDTDYYQLQLIKPTSLLGLDLFSGYRIGTGNFPIYEGKSQTLDKGEWHFGFNLPLIRNFFIDTRRAELRKTELGIKIKNLQLREAELEEIKNALFSYLNLVSASLKLRINKDLFAMAQERDTWINKRVKLGDIPQFERDDNQRTILKRQADLIKSQQQLNIEIQNLSYFISDSKLQEKLKNENYLPNKLPNFDESIVNTNIQAFIENSIGNRPDYLNITNEINQNEIDLELQNNKYLPKLDLKTKLSNDSGTGNSTLIGNNAEVMLNLEVPIQQRSIRGKDIQLKAKNDQLELKKQLAKQKIDIEIRNTFNLIENSIKRRDLAQQELELSKKLEQGERTRLKHGDSNIFTVNIREQATAEAELRLLEAQVDSIKYIIYLKIVSGEIPYKI